MRGGHHILSASQRLAIRANPSIFVHNPRFEIAIQTTHVSTPSSVLPTTFDHASLTQKIVSAVPAIVRPVKSRIFVDRLALAHISRMYCPDCSPEYLCCMSLDPEENDTTIGLLRTCAIATESRWHRCCATRNMIDDIETDSVIMRV